MLKAAWLGGLILMSFAAMADKADSPYQKWCVRSADIEKVAPADRDDFIQECIDRLEDADRNPGKTSSRKGKGDDEG